MPSVHLLIPNVSCSLRRCGKTIDNKGKGCGGAWRCPRRAGGLGRLHWVLALLRPLSLQVSGQRSASVQECLTAGMPCTQAVGTHGRNARLLPSRYFWRGASVLKVSRSRGGSIANWTGHRDCRRSEKRQEGPDRKTQGRHRKERENIIKKMNKIVNFTQKSAFFRHFYLTFCLKCSIILVVKKRGGGFTAKHSLHLNININQ